MRDFDKAKTHGLRAYQTEMNEKIAPLRHRLEKHNDGRRKSYYCTAVILLELEDVKAALAAAEAATAGRKLPQKEKGKRMTAELERVASDEALR